MTPISFDNQISDCRNSLMHSALQFTKNHDDADDLVQDTLIKAIRYEEKYEVGTNLQAWLFIIMRNTFINNYKAFKRRSRVFIENVDPWSYPINSSTGYNAGEGKMINDDINKALRNLQPGYSIPFLRYFEGYKYHEIAIEMDIPIGTVKTRIHIARKILMAKLKR